MGRVVIEELKCFRCVSFNLFVLDVFRANVEECVGFVLVEGDSVFFWCLFMLVLYTCRIYM